MQILETIISGSFWLYALDKHYKIVFVYTAVVYEVSLQSRLTLLPDLHLTHPLQLLRVSPHFTDPMSPWQKIFPHFVLYLCAPKSCGTHFLSAIFVLFLLLLLLFWCSCTLSLCCCWLLSLSPVSCKLYELCCQDYLADLCSQQECDFHFSTNRKLYVQPTCGGSSLFVIHSHCSWMCPKSDCFPHITEIGLHF